MQYLTDMENLEKEKRHFFLDVVVTTSASSEGYKGFMSCYHIYLNNIYIYIT